MATAAGAKQERGRLLVHFPHLISVATAVPPHVLLQKDVAAAAQSIFSGRIDNFERMAGIFAAAGIAKRHCVRPLDWFLEPRGWPDCAAVYNEAAQALFVEAAEKALHAAGLSARDVDGVVTVSSTGICTPSLEARAAGAMGFRPDIWRVPLFGLGCAGGVSGLALAARLAKTEPGSIVLMVAVELCSMAFRIGQTAKANIISTALFADGAAACVLRCGEEGIAAIEASGDHLWPGTLDVMGWDVGSEGLGVILAQAVPPFTEENLGPAIAGILGRNGLQPADIDRFVCHPGGAKVVPALEKTLGLDQGSLDHERAILADYGNMSAPTVLFVLERLLKAGLPSRTALTAMGPGFSASCAVMRRAS